MRRLSPVVILLLMLQSGLVVGQPPASRTAEKEREALLPFKPLGLRDYSKITGFVENASLPMHEPSALWMVVSESIGRDGKVGTCGLSGATIVDGVLYFGDDDGKLVAVDTRDQTELWTYLHGFRIAKTPSVDSDFVFFGSEVGILAVNRKDGELAWTHNIEHGAAESTPIPMGEHVFASGYDGRSYCLDRNSGAVLWVHNFVEDVPADQPGFDGARARFQNTRARPNGSACDGNLFVQCIFDQSRVIALDCDTGKRRWTFQARGWISPAPTFAEGRVYVACQDKFLYCLDVASGALVWKFKTEAWLSSQVAVHDGKVYLPHNGARLYQLDAASGELIQRMEPPDEADRKGSVYSFPIIANQTAYFASGHGQLFAFDIESGEMRWKLNTPDHSEIYSSPTTDGRRIFVTTRKSRERGGEDAILAIGLEP